jgi:thiamine-monophosphate kinase
MSTAWPPRCGWPEREAFARGLAEDQARYGIRLFGGDTVSTPGPLALSLTALGHAPHGRTLSRHGAEPGHLVYVTGTVGDGWLGLMGLKGELPDLEPERLEALASRYRLPEPRTIMTRLLREHASASIDVSDGLVADLGHVADASGVLIELDLDHTPLSRAAKAWLDHRADPLAAFVALATGGDDYEVAFTAAPHHHDALRHGAEALGLPLSVVGRVKTGQGIDARFQGAPVPIARAGWRHG